MGITEAINLGIGPAIDTGTYRGHRGVHAWPGLRSQSTVRPSITSHARVVPQLLSTPQVRDQEATHTHGTHAHHSRNEPPDLVRYAEERARHWQNRVTQQQTEHLYALIIERHRHASFVVTSNRDVSEWGCTMLSSGPASWSEDGWMSTDTKACPFCGEEILSVAIKCKHCLSMLDEASAQSSQVEEILADVNANRTYGWSIVNGRFKITSLRVVFEANEMTMWPLEIHLSDIAQVSPRLAMDMFDTGFLITTNAGVEYKFVASARDHLFDVLGNKIGNRLVRPVSDDTNVPYGCVRGCLYYLGMVFAILSALAGTIKFVVVLASHSGQSVGVELVSGVLAITVSVGGFGGLWLLSHAMNRDKKTKFSIRWF